MKNLNKVFFPLISILIVSFFLNFFWESLHGFMLYDDHHISSQEYVYMMTYMSLMDAVTIIGMYLLLVIFERDIKLIQRFDKKQYIIFFLIGLFVAAFAEYRAVYITKEWSYNIHMPLILGIGLSPLVQLSLTGVLSLWLTRRIINY